MGSSNRYLAVISVLEGRGFPKRSKHKFIVEAKFDGELLATDPVLHTETPDFNQELAWELDKKSLQQHRLQRSSIKIQCYAFDSETTMKESVGYVVMDLRSAAVNKQTPKWHHLLHSKYHKTKPELKLALYLDENTDGDQQSAAVIKEPAISSATNLKTLVPVLNEEDGHYQIGSAETCSEQFVLSVTIAHGCNLAQLIPTTVPLQTSSTGFFFYYSLLGNDVTNEPFYNLASPGFPAERASVKVRSSVDALRLFFSHQPGLQIHLCCGDQSLGNCDIPLTALLKSDSTEIYMRPVTIEGSFELFPANKTSQKTPQIPGNLIPSVGVSVVLRKEDLAVKSPTREGDGAALVTGVPPNVEGKAESPRRGKKENKATDNDAQYSDDTFEESEDQSKGKEEKDKASAQVQPQHQEMPAVLPPVNHGGIHDRVSLPPQAHHFTFSIDLRSIRDNHSTNTIHVFLRYVYPFFGSSAPILTHPPVEIRKGSEVLLPQSFCAFDFACTTQQLHETFARVPLLVEVLNRDRQLSQDVLVGTARLPLNLIVSADKSRMMSSAGVTGWRQEASDRVPVTGSKNPSEKVADISLVLSLEDWGPIVPTQASQKNSGQALASLPEPKVSNPPIQPEVRAKSPQSPPPTRETAEYQAAIELEVWKESQEKDFEKKLKSKEASYMKALAEEWKKRDTEREVLMQKKLSEYQQMEDQLRKTLTDLEKREKRLGQNELEVQKLRADLQREHDRKLQEMKEASRRMKEDCDHQVELQKMKLKEVEDITNRYKQELSESEKKYKTMEKEFLTYKENQTKTPEVRLQTEINLINMEKLELERKLDTATKSKAHYKQQWGRALKEVARLKQQEQDVAKANLQRQQQELEQMRLRYLAAEEKEVVSKETKELDDIRNEINKLKLLEEERLRNTGDSNSLPFMKDASSKPLNMDLDASVDEHVSRLVEERDTLLRTGVYTTQDKIIMELERQIRESVAYQGS